MSNEDKTLIGLGRWDSKNADKGSDKVRLLNFSKMGLWIAVGFWARQGYVVIGVWTGQGSKGCRIRSDFFRLSACLLRKLTGLSRVRASLNSSNGPRQRINWTTLNGHIMLAYAMYSCVCMIFLDAWYFLGWCTCMIWMRVAWLMREKSAKT